MVTEIKPISSTPTELKPKTEKAILQEQIEAEKLKKELEAQKLGFKDFEEFKKTKEQVDLKLAEIIKREEDITEREKMVIDREAQVVKGAETNKRVENNIRINLIKEYKKSKHQIEYARATYYNKFDELCSKLLNCRVGKSCIGFLVKDGKISKKDEPVCMDYDFQEEIKAILNPILKLLKKSPKFTEEGEYLTDDEIQPDEEINDEDDDDLEQV